MSTMRIKDLTRDEVNNLFPKIDISGTEELTLSGCWIDGKYIYELSLE